MSDDSTIINISCDALHNKQCLTTVTELNDKIQGKMNQKTECQELDFSAKRLATSQIQTIIKCISFFVHAKYVRSKKGDAVKLAYHLCQLETLSALLFPIGQRA